MYRATSKNRQRGESDRQDESDQGGEVKFGPAFPFPLEARVKQTGERLTLLGPCDWENHSLANYGVDRQGQQVIVTWEEAQITDHRIPNENALEAQSTRNMGASTR